MGTRNCGYPVGVPSSFSEQMRRALLEPGHFDAERDVDERHPPGPTRLEDPGNRQQGLPISGGDPAHGRPRRIAGQRQRIHPAGVKEMRLQPWQPPAVASASAPRPSARTPAGRASSVPFPALTLLRSGFWAAAVRRGIPAWRRRQALARRPQG